MKLIDRFAPLPPEKRLQDPLRDGRVYASKQWSTAAADAMPQMIRLIERGELPRLTSARPQMPSVAGGRGNVDGLDRDAAGFRASSQAPPELLTGLGSVASGQQPAPRFESTQLRRNCFSVHHLPIPLFRRLARESDPRAQ